MKQTVEEGLELCAKNCAITNQTEKQYVRGYKEGFKHAAAWQKEQDYESLFQMYMTMKDVKALKVAVLGATDVAQELCIRCDNITAELFNHLRNAGFKSPK